MTDDILDLKVGSDGVDGWKFNLLVDAVNELQAGGGGSQPVTRQSSTTSSTPVTINDGDGAQLPWTVSGSGPDTLIDATDPTAPLILEAGVYAIAATVWATSHSGEPTAGGFFTVDLTIDAANPDFTFETNAIDSPPLNTGGGLLSAGVQVTGTWYVPDGGTFYVSASNADGDGVAYDIQILTWAIQRLSGPAA